MVSTGCGRGGAKALVIAHEGGVVGLDPHGQDEAVTVSVLANIYQGLVAFDPNLKVVPCLAEGYSNPDDLTWRFHLREGVRFHDGRRVAIEDVIWSLERAWRDSSSIFRGMLSQIRGIGALDPATLEITTARPHPTLINILPQVAVIPRGSHPSEQPVGTGPYRYLSPLSGGGIRMERFEGYWGEKPPFPRAEFRNITDERRRSAALLSGRIDFDASVSEGQRSRMESSPGVTLKAWPGASVGVLGYDLKGRLPGNPLADVRVRQALSLAIDRDRLSQAAYQGYTLPAWQLVAQTVLGYDPELPKPARDTARARILLAKAGFPGGLKLTLEMSGTAWPVGRELSRQLGEAGVELRVDTVSWERLYQDISAGRAGFYLMGFGFGFGDASEVLNELHSRAPEGLGANNLTGYSNPAMDRLLEAADREFDPAKRQALLKKAVRLAAEDLPFIPLYVRESCYGLRRGLDWSPRSDGLVLAAEFRMAR
jgi:peptide/nickel transport system substrate-binding protein